MSRHRHQVLIAVAFTGRTSSESDTEQHRLLNDEDEHTRNEERAVATSGIEYRHFFEVQRFRLNLVFAVGEVAAEGNLYLRIHIAGHSLSSLEDGLIGEHERHVAIDADMGLLHAQEAVLEVRGEIEHAVHHLFSYQSACLVKILAIICHPGIG